jgi:hypothetical protein
MADVFANHVTGLESPATRLLAVVPSDGSDLAFVSRALNVSGSGLIRVTTAGGDIATVHVAAGTAFPIRATRVWQTGTTATGIVAMF